MAIEHVRVCGACERECPSWANRCPVCGSLSLLYRVTFVPKAAVVPNPALAVAKTVRKGAARSRIVAARDTKRRPAPGARGPETRAV